LDLTYWAEDFTHSIYSATPLKGQTQADDSGKEEDEADGVQLSELLFEGDLRLGPLRNMEQEEDEQYHGAAKGQVQ
jgi:hypothetical protein